MVAILTVVEQAAQANIYIAILKNGTEKKMGYLHASYGELLHRIGLSLENLLILWVCDRIRCIGFPCICDNSLSTFWMEESLRDLGTRCGFERGSPIKSLFDQI